ncbi:DUF7847 domain-containing protein [Methanolobus halotolerans]|uniref:DUF7847 domain-containing protein n=1 Tax=Methanolobus halotolerans TaxID=2052935 RepID=A0A4E0Q4P0_9EURY|nr:hypothetical protein [Methanolobus halotolerans]TGC08746.1 hypothetical protein CUN85_08745 [Methanolobus halotolerans]
MNEDIGTIIRRGFSTWKRNLIICIPFISEVLVTVLLSMLAAFLFVMLFIMPVISGSNIDPEQLSPDAMLNILESLLSDNLLVLIAFGIIFFLLYMLVQSFFTAGAIGMSKEALEKGDTNVGDMSSYGSKNFFNLFLLKVMVSLLALAGVIFLIPGFLSIGNIGDLLADPSMALASTSLLIFGLFIWGFYALLLSIILIFVEYALVIDRLDPVSAIGDGVSFFMSNKVPALILWSLVIGITVIFGIIGNIFSYNDVLSQMWTFADFLLSIIIIRPLITIWWTRFYLNRNDKKLYSFDDYLLDH